MIMCTFGISSFQRAAELICDLCSHNDIGNPTVCTEFDWAIRDACGMPFNGTCIKWSLVSPIPFVIHTNYVLETLTCCKKWPGF